MRLSRFKFHESSPRTRGPILRVVNEVRRFSDHSQARKLWVPLSIGERSDAVLRTAMVTTLRMWTRARSNSNSSRASMIAKQGVNMSASESNPLQAPHGQTRLDRRMQALLGDSLPKHFGSGW